MAFHTHESEIVVGCLPPGKYSGKAMVSKNGRPPELKPIYAIVILYNPCTHSVRAAPLTDFEINPATAEIPFIEEGSQTVQGDF